MLWIDLGYLLILLLTLPLWLRYLFRKEYRESLKYRFRPREGLPEDQPGGKRIWIHAVSVGEVHSLKEIVARLTARTEKLTVVMTVTTPSGFKRARQLYPDLAVLMAPLDFTWVIRRFLRRIRPDLIVLNELEVWPNWLIMAKRQEIPVVLINGRVSEAALKRYLRLRAPVGSLLNLLHRILLQSELYRERFERFGVERGKMAVCGNMKADEALHMARTMDTPEGIVKRLGLRSISWETRLILCVASSHAEDERVLLEVLPLIREKYLVILVPRHLDRVPGIVAQLREKGVSFRRWSRPESSDTLPVDLLLFDGMGELPSLMALSHLVYMGGTMESRIGGHNLYEPAALGRRIIGGPHFNNFPVIGSGLVESGGYRVTESAGEIAAYLEKFEPGVPHHEAGSHPSTRGERSVHIVERLGGAVECIIGEIGRILD